MIGDDQWLVFGDEECQVPVEDRFSFYRSASEDSHKSTSHHAPRSMKCHQKSLEKKPYKIKKGTKWAAKGSPNGHKSSQRLPKGTQGLPKGSPKVPKWAQGGPKGSQEGPMGVPRAPQGVPRGPQGSPPGSKTSPRGAPGERSWNLLLGVPKKKHQNTAK